MGYSLTELGIGARNPSSAAVRGTKGGVAPGLMLRKLQLRPLDLQVLEELPETARCSTGGGFVELLLNTLELIKSETSWFAARLLLAEILVVFTFHVLFCET